VPITKTQGLPTGDHLRRDSAPSPRRTPEEPWDVTYYMSGLTSQFYWCAPSACEEDLELQDFPSGGYAYRGGDGPCLQEEVASAPFGKVLAAFSPLHAMGGPY
jgi:hypothetical protein